MSTGVSKNMLATYIYIALAEKAGGKVSACIQYLPWGNIFTGPKDEARARPYSEDCQCDTLAFQTSLCILKAQPPSKSPTLRR